jgi:hypothetical protein
MKKAVQLTIRDFAQVADMKLEFGDLTVLVGAQGTGKSLALQWLKAAIDGKQIVKALRDAGYRPEKTEEYLDLIFGLGMSSAWRETSRVTFRERELVPTRLSRSGTTAERAAFVPAHRSMLISDGWAQPFQKLTPDTPVVARLFSQRLFDRFNAPQSERLFPADRRLKREYRELIEQAIYHGGTIGLEQEPQRTKRLKLKHGRANLPFMTWAAGQREFTPLLLALYGLLLPRKSRKDPHVEWVIIEEPEMGLHPQAITAFLALVLDLLWRGYRVVLSTHSPHVLTAVWMLRGLRELRADPKWVCDGFGIEGSQAIKRVAREALGKSMFVHLLKFAGRKVRAFDISGLDPGSENEKEAGWGGLTGFSSRFGEAVRGAVNERGA